MNGKEEKPKATEEPEQANVPSEQETEEEKTPGTAEEEPKEAKETTVEKDEIEEEKPETAEKEEAKPEKKRKKEEEEIVEERIYTVPLSKAWIMPPRKRAPRAMRILRSFVLKHMKLEAKKETEEEEEEEIAQLVISNEVNEKVWSRGIEKPPRKVRIRAAKDKEGNVTVYLAEGD